MKKILIVEDNELNMKLFFDILTYQNYAVEKSYDGQDAYEKLKINTYDLIILDIQLPKLDGFSLIEKLKNENTTLCPIIIVSACAMDLDKQKAANYGINDYLTKPIDINNFIQTIRQKIGK